MGEGTEGARGLKGTAMRLHEGQLLGVLDFEKFKDVGISCSLAKSMHNRRFVDRRNLGFLFLFLFFCFWALAKLKQNYRFLVLCNSGL